MDRKFTLLEKYLLTLFGVYIGYYFPQVTSFRKLLTYTNKFDVILKQKEANSAPFVLIKIFGINTFAIFTIT